MINRLSYCQHGILIFICNFFCLCSVITVAQVGESKKSIVKYFLLESTLRA